MSQRTGSRYIPSLDGLRAASILLVILAHLEFTHLIPGGFGVTLFFFISGYLLTGQMLSEHARTGRISFRGFYLRRALRLMPAALTFIVVAGLGFVAMGGHYTPLGWAAAVFYGANYYDIFAHYTNIGAPTALNPFNILWSLAVEEHFYMLWPLALTLTLAASMRAAKANARRRYQRVFAALLLVCIVEPIWRNHLFASCLAPGLAPDTCGSIYRVYKATDTRLDSIAWGALAAVLMALPSPWYLRVIRSRAAQLAALLVLLASFYPNEHFREVYRYTVDGVTLGILIPAIAERQTPFNWLFEMWIAVFVGRISYSLYLWHWAAFGAASYATGGVRDASWFALALGLSVVLALASWFGVETPMLRLRRRAGSHVPLHIAAEGGTRAVRLPQAPAETTS